MATLIIILSIFIPWTGGLIVWLIGDQHSVAQHRLAGVTSALGGLVSLLMLLNIQDTPLLTIEIGGVFGSFTLVPDGLGVYLAIIAAVIGSLAVIFSNNYMRGEAQLGRYYSLMLLFIGAMIGLVLSGSLLFMFVFWEITAFCSYALISFHNDDPKAVYGGIKALIMTQVGGVGLLLLALASYVYLGSYQVNNFLANAEQFPTNVLVVLAFGTLLAAAAKSAQVPFHTWLPDAMEAPTPISALIHAATMVNAGVYLLARTFPAFEGVSGWVFAVMSVGLLSALLPAILAAMTDDLKRTLAYSTISQLGYMVFAIGVTGIFASQFHLMSHSIFKALLFLGAGAIIHGLGTRDMRQMGGLGKSMQFVAVVFIIGALALTGLPITNGFFSKELVLESGLLHGPVWAYAVMLIGVAITGFYSIRMLTLVFFDPSKTGKQPHPAGLAMRISLAILAAGTLLSWLLAGPFSKILAGSLPFHDLEAETTLDIVVEVVSQPATWVTLAIVLVGIGLWYLRGRLVGISRALEPIGHLTRNDYGFEWLNRQIIMVANLAASELRRTQTGQLNWNVLGIAGALVLLVILIAWIG